MSVIRELAWRRIAATFGAEIPAVNSSAAKEWRRSCGATFFAPGGLSFAAFPATRTALATACLLRGFPVFGAEHDVVAFEDEDESAFVGLLQVEAADERATPLARVTHRPRSPFS